MDTVQLYSKGPLAESLNAFLRSLEGKNHSELTRKVYHQKLEYTTRGHYCQEGYDRVRGKTEGGGAST